MKKDDATQWQRVQVIDSHTGGEPTRVVISGGPEWEGQLSMEEGRERLRTEHDWLRTTVVNEPRGSDAVVGALLCEPKDPECDVGVIFFNNVGYINMCVHGTIGLAVTLEWLGRLPRGKQFKVETPVGVVTAHLRADGGVTVANVPSYRTLSELELEVPGFGSVKADVAWGGNWFLLVHEHALDVRASNIRQLTAFSQAAREELVRRGIKGDDSLEIDHIEVFADPQEGVQADSQNFVLCPGGAYDRSPCGTGTSAKLACLHASGRLREGEVWRQASIVGSVFEGTVAIDEEGRLIPSITGRAHISGEATVLVDPADPFGYGIPAG